VPLKSDQLKDLTDRAQNGDKSTLPALRELLKDPATVDVAKAKESGRCPRRLPTIPSGPPITNRVR
jgi:hypothetical protein